MSDVEAATPSRVRVLTAADVEIYRPLRLQALRELPPAFGSRPEDEPDLDATARRFSACGDERFFGAFVDGRLVGSVRLSRYESPNERHRAFLAGLYVLQTHRSRGCGRALVAAALGRAASIPEIRRVYLTVVSGQTAARQLYESFGFCLYGTEPEVFCRDGQFYDEHLLSLAVASRLDANT